MRMNIDVVMDYQLDGPGPVLLAIEAAAIPGQRIENSMLEILNATHRHVPGEAGLGRRIWANVINDRLNLRYVADVEITRDEIPLQTLAQCDWQDLPSDVLSYLRPSRFCPSDQFMPFVAKSFGHLDAGAKVAAIRDWVAEAVTYVSGSSDAATCANDTFVSREGVCRDFAHLVCTLVRAAQIPARYTSGYGPGVTPPDFHAVAEVWLDGAWHVVDATGMSTSADLAIIGTGRDASDVAFMETQSPANPTYQNLIITRR
ncbi:MAG: transglutaminase family protein [Rhodobacteraceae bacterium]|nr:MAG: transglutaminase family protein [Paracoccaceae bacterium]